MHAMIEEYMRQRFLSNEAVAAKIAELESKVRAGLMPPSVAAGEAASLIAG
jgi:hypothetical protein